METTMSHASIVKGSIARRVAFRHTDQGTRAPKLARGMEQRRYEYDR
jgi:hypothetical protein